MLNREQNLYETVQVFFWHFHKRILEQKFPKLIFRKSEAYMQPLEEYFLQKKVLILSDFRTEFCIGVSRLIQFFDFNLNFVNN